jgi:hypothetical protein
MTTRERHLTGIVAGILGVAGIGVISYWFVLSPLMEKDKQITQRTNEVAQLELDIMTIQAEKKKYEMMRQQSLPSDVGVSRTQYTSLLEGLIRRADFGAGTYKITVAEPDSKSAPTVAPKKPAYTKLNFDVTLKGQVYHVADFLQMFYHQPLLHSIKSINIQRPSDAKAQLTRQLDVVMKIEALVLDNAPARPTLLPVIRELALLSGGAAQTGYNLHAVSGRGSPIPPAGVLADVPREYLAIASKDIFFGPGKPPPTRGDSTVMEEDHSPFVTLTSVVGHDDGSLIAVFRDKLDNHNYTIRQSPKGDIAVVGEYELGGNMKVVPGYSKDKDKQGRMLFYGSDDGGNWREWRVRRVLLDSVIVEKIEKPDGESKPKPHPLAAIGGGPGAFVAVPEGKIYKVGVGQDLETDPKDSKSDKRSAPPPSKYLLTREAWRDIYAPLIVPTAAGEGG